MANVTYSKQLTALLVVDPYNDFISEGGKIWDRIRAVAEANGCIPHMLQVLNAARKAKLRVFYALLRAGAKPSNRLRPEPRRPKALPILAVYLRKYSTDYSPNSLPIAPYSIGNSLAGRSMALTDPGRKARKPLSRTGGGRA